MKKLLFTGAFLFSSLLLLHAQKEQTLTGSARTKGGFGGLYNMYSSAAGNAGFGAGFDGAFIVNDFFIGGFLQAEAFGNRQVNNRDYTLGYAATGLMLGYAYPSYKSIHLYTALRMGPGGVVLTSTYNDTFNNNNDLSDGIFLFSPEIGAEFNLVHWLRLAVTAGYRQVNGLNHLTGFSSTAFNRPFLSISMRAGKFGYAKSSR